MPTRLIFPGRFATKRTVCGARCTTSGSRQAAGCQCSLGTRPQAPRCARDCAFLRRRSRRRHLMSCQVRDSRCMMAWMAEALTSVAMSFVAMSSRSQLHRRPLGAPHETRHGFNHATLNPKTAEQQEANRAPHILPPVSSSRSLVAPSSVARQKSQARCGGARGGAPEQGCCVGGPFHHSLCNGQASRCSGSGTLATTA